MSNEIVVYSDAIATVVRSCNKSCSSHPDCAAQILAYVFEKPIEIVRADMDDAGLLPVARRHFWDEETVELPSYGKMKVAP